VGGSVRLRRSLGRGVGLEWDKWLELRGEGWKDRGCKTMRAGLERQEDFRISCV
jgi:hypothetical protein